MATDSSLHRLTYPGDLTDHEWRILTLFFPLHLT